MSDSEECCAYFYICRLRTFSFLCYFCSLYSQFFLAPTCDIEVAHTEAAPFLEATDIQQHASDTTHTKSGMQDAGMGAEKRKEHKAGFSQSFAPLEQEIQEAGMLEWRKREEIKSHKRVANEGSRRMRVGFTQREISSRSNKGLHPFEYKRQYVCRPE